MIVSISFDFDDNLPEIQKFEEPLEIELIYQIEKEDSIMTPDTPLKSHRIDSEGLPQER